MAQLKPGELSVSLLFFITLTQLFEKGVASDDCPIVNDRHDRPSGVRHLCSSREISCQPREQLQISNAYFYHVPPVDVCVRGQVICWKGTKAKDPDQCFSAIDRQTGTSRCWQRLTDTDFFQLYALCETNCTLNTLILSDKSTFFVDYICVPEQTTIDPCTALPPTTTTSSIMLQTTTQRCDSTCVIVPTNQTNIITLNYNFLAADNSATVQYLFEHQRSAPDSAWTSLLGTYYHSDVTERNVKKMWIKFQLPNPARVSRLWIHLNDAVVNITCYLNAATIREHIATQGLTSTTPKATAQNPSTREQVATQGLTSTIDPTTPNTTAKYPSTKDKEDVNLNSTHAHALIIGLVGGLLTASVGFVAFLVWKKRERRYARPLPGRRWPAASDRGHVPPPPAPSGYPDTNSNIYDEIPECQRDQIDLDGCSLPMAPPPPGQIQEGVGRPSDHSQPAPDQSTSRVCAQVPLTRHSGRVDKSGWAQCGERVDADGYAVITHAEGASVDVDGYQIPRPVVRPQQADGTPVEYVELLP